LEVVDRHDDRRGAAQFAQRAQHGPAAVEHVGLRVERAGRGVDLLEEVEQTRHRPVQLLLRRPRDEDPVPRPPVLFDAPSPQGGFPNARLAVDHDEARARIGRAHQLTDAIDLRIAADQDRLDRRRGAGGHGATVAEDVAAYSRLSRARRESSVRDRTPNFR
jgi:hypothetical protein